MIPMIPVSTPDEEVPTFYKAIVDNLKIRSSHHESWHTHKRDPSVCWICDLIEISTILMGEMERYLSKSSLDIDDQSHDSEISTEGEIVNADSG